MCLALWLPPFKMRCDLSLAVFQTCEFWPSDSRAALFTGSIRGDGQKWPSPRRPIDSVQSGGRTSVSTSPVHHNLQTFITNFSTEDRSLATLPHALNCEVKELVDERDRAEKQVCCNTARHSGVDSEPRPNCPLSPQSHLLVTTPDRSTLNTIERG